MAKDAKDNKTLELTGVKPAPRPRGRVPSGNAVSAAERKAQSRARQRAEAVSFFEGLTPLQADIALILSRMSEDAAHQAVVVAGAMRLAREHAQ